MKLYMHPVSTACRPVRLFMTDNKIDCEEELVDLMKGAHHQEPFASLNPNRLVPCWSMVISSSPKARRS
jgi:glutathione S-transferase